MDEDDDLTAVSESTEVAGEAPTETMGEGDAPTVMLDELATRVGESVMTAVPGVERDLAADMEAARQDGTLVRDRFILVASIGAGGMGYVFQARDIRREEAADSNSLVAIKFLNASFSEHSAALVSLQREARKTQELAHPNIVTVYDFDRDVDRVFMTMEYLDGAPLGNLEKLEKKLGVTFDRVDLLRQIAEGLAYAHSRHYVHSDLKPDNVFVTNEGRVKVLDFGIARMTAEAGRQDSFDAGSLGALTPRYASVEMLRGGEEPHPADDVFALGIIGWQLFSGEHPYGRQTALEALESHGDIPALEGLTARQRKALQRAISLKRTERQADAGQFLREFMGNRQRNRLLAAMAAAVVLISAAWIYTALQPEGPEVPFAELPASVQTQFTESMDRGDEHESIGDWDGALNYYSEAWDLHPRNPEANDALDRIAEHLMGLESSISVGDGPAYLAAIRRLRVNPYLQERIDLAELEARWNR